MKVTICGFGRIGRLLARALADAPWASSIDIVDPAYGTGAMRDFLAWDSVYGNFAHPLTQDGATLTANGKPIRKVDAVGEGGIVIEATGGTWAVDATRPGLYVTDDPGRWEKKFPGARTSAHFFNTCDGRAIVPVVRFVQQRLAITSVGISTVHPVMNTQPCLDRGIDDGESVNLERSFMRNLIPKGTSADVIVARECGIDLADIVATSFRSPHDAVTAATIDIGFEPAAVGGYGMLDALAQSGIFTKVVDNAVSGQGLGEAIVLLKSMSKENRRMLRVSILYDNELGYVNSVLAEIARREFN